MEEKYTNYGKSAIWYPCDQNDDASGCSGPYDDLTCGKRVFTEGSGADVEGVMQQCIQWKFCDKPVEKVELQTWKCVGTKVALISTKIISSLGVSLVLLS
jgi:hypothetical protein